MENVDALVRKSDDPPSPTSDEAKHAIDVLQFFINKIELIRETTNDMPSTVFIPHVSFTTETFQSTTTEQLMKLIADAPNKHCSLDPVKISLVKNCLLLLALFLSKLFNRFLSESYLTTSHKLPSSHCYLRRGDWT